MSTSASRPVRYITGIPSIPRQLVAAPPPTAPPAPSSTVDPDSREAGGQAQARLGRARRSGRPPAPAAHVARAELTTDLLRRAGACQGAERHRLLDEVVTANMGVATAIAARYRTRGIATEDLQQVAYLALVKAANGYDAEVGTDFLSYAVPTMRGEIKRHFRDLGWMVRPPRRIQELQARITAADAELSQSLGRSPRPSEVAAHLDSSTEDVEEALATVGCFAPTSLDRPATDDGTMSISDLLGDEDIGQGAVEARTMLAPVVRRLGERDRRILLLRFFRGWTQQEIAEDIGVTQMQVSRLLTRILGELRTGLGVEETVAGGGRIREGSAVRRSA